MDAPVGPSMLHEVHAGSVVARLGAINSTVGRATTDMVMNSDAADEAQGGPLHAAVGGVELARSGGST